MPNTPKSKSPKFIPGKGYEKLVSDIKKIIDEAYVKGVDWERMHLLNCYVCGCFEGMTDKGSRVIYQKDGSPTGLDVDFKVLNVKQRSYILKNRTLRWRTTYNYICGLCDANQVVCHVDEFSDKSKENQNETKTT